MRQSLLQLVRMQDYLDEEERQEREAKLKAEAEKIAKEKAEQEAAERKIAEAAAKEQRELEAAERLIEQVEAIEITPPDAPASDAAEKQEKTPVTSPTQKRAEGVTSPLLEGNNKDSPKTSLFDRLKTRVRALTGGDAENPEEALAAKLAYLASHPARCAELGEKAMSRAKSTFDWNHVVAEYEKLFEELGVAATKPVPAT